MHCVFRYKQAIDGMSYFVRHIFIALFALTNGSLNLSKILISFKAFLVERNFILWSFAYQS